jgi:small subunit ribosomal protein S27Ae
MAENKEKKKKSFKPYAPGKACPKCGCRLAAHRDRSACGKCGYTEFNNPKK